MTKDEIQTEILRVCKVANWDGDFNVVGFYALCDALVKLGAIEEREACAQIAAWILKMPENDVSTAIRAKLTQPEPVIQARKEGDLIVADLPKVPTGGGGIYKEEQHKSMHPAIKKMYEDYFDKHFEETSKKREWVGLTKEDLETIHQDLFNMSGWSFNTMAKAIEAKLKKKNTKGE